MSHLKEYASVRESSINSLADRGDIVLVPTPAKCAKDLPKGAQSYLTQIVSELSLGQPIEFDTAAIQRGHEMEPRAIAEFEWVKNKKVVSQGLQLHPKFEDVGASVDGLIGLDETVEVKCPTSQVRHMRCFVLDQVPEEHIPQIQWQLWVTGRQRCHFISYYPEFVYDTRFRLFTKIVERNEDYINTIIRPRAFDFIKVLRATKRRLQLPDFLNVFEEEYTA
jgi:putative phage-type endonuclease